MPLEPGTTLGPYSVTAKIGEGGYQARDTKLDRDVALKVLPEAFTSDPDRLARFEREAKVLASLNHPNIGSIYGLEEAEGVRALVLELVEGPTLADRATEPFMCVAGASVCDGCRRRAARRRTRSARESRPRPRHAVGRSRTTGADHRRDQYWRG